MYSNEKTYARSRFIRRMFFLANNSLKYNLSLSYQNGKRGRTEWD